MLRMRFLGEDVWTKLETDTRSIPVIALVTAASRNGGNNAPVIVEKNWNSS